MLQIERSKLNIARSIHKINRSIIISRDRSTKSIVISYDQSIDSHHNRGNDPHNPVLDGSSNVFERYRVQSRRVSDHSTNAHTHANSCIDRAVGVLLVHAGHGAQQAMEEVRILLLLALACKLQFMCPTVW